MRIYLDILVAQEDRANVPENMYGSHPIIKR